MSKVKRTRIHPEDWRTLQRIANGSKITEQSTPNMGMEKSFTVGKGRVHWNSSILDNFAAHGYLDRSTNTVTPNGTLALIFREAKL
jgi:hypothetical protein